MGIESAICDNGHGISKENIEQIFDPFFTTKAVGQGYGLGLSMVHGSVKMHQGIITVESSLEAGTCFHLYFPLLESLPDKQTEPGSVHSWQGNGETLLIVDDSADVREAVALTLESLGYQVLQADGGQQAADVFRDHAERIRLIIMDLVMPGISGVKAAQLIRQQKPQLPIIFFSGYDKNQILPPDELPEYSMLLGKPISIDILAQHIRSLLHQKTPPKTTH